MLVSVIIPTYNRAHLIEEAIKSVLNQTYKDVEIIVIDDGSTDDTKNIVEKYLTSIPNKIRYHYKKNGGVSSARNLGIEMARGEYISFLDSDDLLFESKIEKQLKAMQKDHVSVCYCGYVLIDKATGQYFKMTSRFKKGNILIMYLKNKVRTITNAWLFSRKIFLNNKGYLKFREDYSWREDMEVFSKILLKEKVTYVNEVLAAEVKHGSDRLSNFDIKHIEKDIYIWNEFWIWVQQNLSDCTYRRTIMKVIFQYRIPGFIIYKCNEIFRDKPEEVKNILRKYKKFVSNIGFCNDIRSLKLLLFYYLLKIKIRLLK